MAKITAPKGERTSPRAVRKPLSRQLRLYQHIAVGFVVVTFLLLLGVLYLSVSRATIRITPRAESVSTTVSIEVSPNPNEGQVAGISKTTTLEKSRVFALGAENATPVEGKASGYVTLVNESANAQPLVVNTRLLSDGGVLFRIQEYVTVPSNSEIQVLALADQPGKGGEIGPAKFTIPGLPVSLQESIYAVSTEAMTGGVQYVRAINQDDIDNAITELETEILVESKAVLGQGIDRALYDSEEINVDIVSSGVTVAVGQEVGSFTATAKANVEAVWYNEEQLLGLAGAELASEVSDGFKLFSLNEDGAEISVGDLDAASGSATLVVVIKGISIIAETAPSLDKDRFVGRAPHEVLTLLRASEAVEEASLSFTPFWLKRVPTLKDHIKIIIEKPKE